MYVFEGITKEKAWGRELWKLSDMEGAKTLVKSGESKGKTAGEVIGGRFPLLVKKIEAREDLSVQVHPEGDMKQGGKTEMWYVMKAEAGASVYSGWSREVSKEEFWGLCEQGRVLEALRRYEVQEGDVFYVPGGQVHAIGGGVELAEIQQSSDTTYRIYDYGRGRELHRAPAEEAIDYSYREEYKTSYVRIANTAVELVRSAYFTVHYVEATRTVTRIQEGGYKVYMCVSGSALIREDDEEGVTLETGETALSLGDSGRIEISPAGGGERTKVLETYVSEKGK
jgi:mannose-6-phosphate isomerase